MHEYALLVPCYNAQIFIDDFLKNLSRLDRSFNEVIFYDDASTDDTLQLLLSHNLHVIQGVVNKGPGYARNRLAEATTCGYIHFHDIDDEFNPEFLKLIDNKLKSSAVDIVLGSADWVDASTKLPIIKWRYNENEIKNNALAYFITNPLGIINTIYKREIFLKVGGFNENIKCWEDADLHIRLAANGSSFAVINAVLAYSLRHNNGISNDQLWCWSCRLKFIEEYLKNYPQVDRSLLETEIKKAQNAFIINGDYKRLNSILMIKKRYKLALRTHRIAVVYLLSHLLPSSLITELLRLHYLKINWQKTS